MVLVIPYRIHFESYESDFFSSIDELKFSVLHLKKKKSYTVDLKRYFINEEISKFLDLGVSQYPGLIERN